MLLDYTPHNKMYNDFVVNVIGTHPPNPAVSTFPSRLLKDGNTNDYDEDFSRYVIYYQ